MSWTRTRSKRVNMNGTDPFEGHSLTDLLDAQAARVPDSPFVWWEGEPIRYAGDE